MKNKILTRPSRFYCGTVMTEKEYFQSWMPPGQQPPPVSYRHFFDRDLEKEE